MHDTQAKERQTTTNNWKTPGTSVSGRYNNPLCPVVQLAYKRHRQRDLPLRLAPSQVDPLKRARFLEVSIRFLQPFDHDRRDQVQAGPVVGVKTGGSRVGGPELCV